MIQLKGFEWFDFNTEQVFTASEPEIADTDSTIKAKPPRGSGAV